MRKLVKYHCVLVNYKMAKDFRFIRSQGTKDKNKFCINKLSFANKLSGTKNMLI